MLTALLILIALSLTVCGGSATAATVHSVQGHVFIDTNKNKILNIGEKPIIRVQVTLYDSKGKLITKQFTNATGFYSFSNLAVGSYKLVSAIPTLYKNTTPSTVLFSVTSKTGAVIINFGDVLRASATPTATPTVNPSANAYIVGLKYYDTNKNGKYDSGEAGLPNWTIQVQEPQTQLTTSGGNFNFTVKPGMYIISEVLKPGYTNTSPTSIKVTVTAGEVLNVTTSFGAFGNILTPILPVPGFTVTPQTGPVPLTVQVTDTSTGATSWQYSFGDSTPNATTPNPTHTYTANGTFVITQTVSNVNGSASTSHVVIVGGNSTNVTPVNLGAVCTDNLTILAETEITNVPTSAIGGNMGLSPAASSFITGFALVHTTGSPFATSAQVSGKVYAANYGAPTPAMLTNDVIAMHAAYTDAAGRPNPTAVNLGGGEIGGFTLPGGIYKWTSGLSISTADLTLDGGGNPNAVWIFQIGSGLNVGSGRKIILTNGAQAKNIFWQVGTNAVIGTNARFNGVILTGTAINMQTGAQTNGNLLAQSAVTLDTNIVNGAC